MSNTFQNLTIDTIELVKVEVKDLKIGMFVSKLDRPWLETHFLFQGFELKTQADIEAVQRQCNFVFIDVSKQSQVPRYVARSTAYSKDYLDQVKPPEKRKSFTQEIKRAENIYNKTSSLVKNFMEEVRLGQPINVVVAKKAVAACVDSILNVPDALMLMTQLKNRDEYTAQHSMNVCVFSIALGRQINLSLDELNNVGLCGMMHDMGKMLIAMGILNKPGRLTAEELPVMQSHTVKGWNLLMRTSGMYAGAVDVAHMHHERMDGMGYPRQLHAEQITPYSRIVAIADMYDAVSSDRVYKPGKSHLEAIKILTDAGGSHLDSGLTMKFIECLGIYPAGSIVELASGQIALVLEVNPKAKLKPKIMILQEKLNQPCLEFVVDLAMLSQNVDGRDYAIKKVLRPEACGIDLLKYVKAGLFEKVLASEARK